MNRRELVRSILAFGSVFAGTILSREGRARTLEGFDFAPPPSDAEPSADPQGRESPVEIEPFRIDYGSDRIDELHRRIDATRWPELPFDTGWSAGTNDGVLRDLVRHWREEYDWSDEQARLNRLDHFRVAVEGERIHFVRYRPRGDGGPARPFPLLLLHGWPSSFLEFERAAPLLAEGSDGEPGFEVIVPSLPGYAFSDPPREPGMHPGRVAERMHGLMQAMGHERYGVDGGDWGWIVGRALARSRPEAVVGLHLPGMPAWEAPEDRDPTEDERAFLDWIRGFRAEEMAYYDLQATKPQSLAYALQDSPVGLAAWFLEKWWEWADHPDDLWSVIDRDAFLTTVMLYWLPGRVLSSSRIYYERAQANPSDRPSGPITVPTWFAGFPRDPFTSAPRSLAVSGDYENIVHLGEQPRGGHFPALERPEAWAADVRAFFSTL